MASLPNRNERSPEPVSFPRSLGYSALLHGTVLLSVALLSKFNPGFWKKPPQPASVVWTQAVKRPTPTRPDKLPPPLVPLKKPEEPKPEEINVTKTAPEEMKELKKEETREEKMKKALEKLRKNTVEDDRPTPREDNFPTAPENPVEGVMSESEILAVQASSVYIEYIARLRQIVEGNRIWFGNKLETSISMRIDPQGQISNIQIAKSSGDFAYDQAMLRAVHKSNPVPPPPTEERIQQMFIQQPVVMNFGKDP